MSKSALVAFHSSAIVPRRSKVLGAMICDILPRDATVLDVGSGDGTIASLWQEMRPDLQVEGIDILVRTDTKIPVRGFDGCTIPYNDRSVDVVTFVDVLHHTDDATRLLREAVRVSRTWVVIKDHYAETQFDRSTLVLMDWVGNAHHGVALPYNYWSRAEWSRAFKMAGLTEDRSVTKIPLYPFPLQLAFGRGLHFISRLKVGH